jgi:hypothetical protein
MPLRSCEKMKSRWRNPLKEAVYPLNVFEPRHVVDGQAVKVTAIRVSKADQRTSAVASQRNKLGRSAG